METGITYYYCISTGIFSSDPSDTWPLCYSGGGASSIREHKPEHKNNPDSMTISNYGPIPAGTWYIIGHTSTKAPYRINLLPEPGFTTRFDFLIHGDNEKHPGESSDGCLIMNGDEYRKKIADAFDKYGQLKLIVTP